MEKYISPQKGYDFWKNKKGKEIVIWEKPPTWCSGSKNAKCPLDLRYPVEGRIEWVEGVRKLGGTLKHLYITVYVRIHDNLYGFVGGNISSFEIHDTVDKDAPSSMSEKLDYAKETYLPGTKFRDLVHNQIWSVKKHNTNYSTYRSPTSNTIYVSIEKPNKAYQKSACIFKNGEWATIINEDQDKVPETKKETECRFKVGDIIEHPGWGTATVIKIDSNNVYYDRFSESAMDLVFKRYFSVNSKFSIGCRIIGNNNVESIHTKGLENKNGIKRSKLIEEDIVESKNNRKFNVDIKRSKLI